MVSNESGKVNRECGGNMFDFPDIQWEQSLRAIKDSVLTSIQPDQTPDEKALMKRLAEGSADSLAQKLHNLKYGPTRKVS